MSRFLFALGVLALSVRAQDEGILTASGDDLSSFRVRLHTSQIDRGTPKSFVRAYTKFLVEMENEVAQRFADLVAREHMAILKRFYTDDLVKRQADAYAKYGKRSRKLAFEIEGVKVRGDRAAVTVKITWEQMKKGTDSTYVAVQRRERLQLVKKGKSWWLNYIEKEVQGKGFEAQQIQVRPRVLAPKIRVNAVAPGFISGRWLKQGLGERYDEIKQAVADQVPLGRVSEPEDVAAAIVSLIAGSDMVTGQILVNDGGMLIAG